MKESRTNPTRKTQRKEKKKKLKNKGIRLHCHKLASIPPNSLRSPTRTPSGTPLQYSRAHRPPPWPGKATSAPSFCPTHTSPSAQAAFHSNLPSLNHGNHHADLLQTMPHSHLSTQPSFHFFFFFSAPSTGAQLCGCWVRTALELSPLLSPRGQTARGDGWRVLFCTYTSPMSNPKLTRGSIISKCSIVTY